MSETRTSKSKNLTAEQKAKAVSWEKLETVQVPEIYDAIRVSKWFIKADSGNITNQLSTETGSIQHLLVYDFIKNNQSLLEIRTSVSDVAFKDLIDKGIDANPLDLSQYDITFTDLRKVPKGVIVKYPKGEISNPKEYTSVQPANVKVSLKQTRPTSRKTLDEWDK